MVTGSSAAALRAYEEAVELMPLVAPRRLIREDREHGIGSLAGLGAEAASVAVATGRPERAVELLEQARGTLLAETMDLRGDVGDLRERDPVLAERFIAARKALDAADHSDRTPAYRDELLATWTSLLAQIRKLPGFSHFLRPPPVSRLRREAPDGDIVIVNVSHYGGDAIIFMGDPDCPVRIVPLPGLTLEAVDAQVTGLARAVAQTGDRDRECRRAGRREIIGVLAWLWHHVTGPILAHLGRTGSPAGPLPRLWWCPVGPLAFLPLHAAAPADGQGAMDHVVSSYTPTVRALGYARRAVRTPPGPRDAVVVAMPYTTGQPNLPGADSEQNRLLALMPRSLPLRGDDATHAAVVAAMQARRIAHFACHGFSDPHNPSRSRLVLRDDAARPLTAAAVARLLLPDAELAYLSACNTTVTAAFQLAGYRHVIGTLWAIDDRIATRLTDEVYTALTDEGRRPPEIGDSARVLHRAVARVRERYPRSPDLWAAHIHVGA
jgi:hypothetical protein